MMDSYPTGPFPARPRRRKTARQQTGPQAQAPGRSAGGYSDGAETHAPATVRDATGRQSGETGTLFPEVMNAQEAAAFLGVGVTTIYRAMKEGLPSRRVRGRRLFTRRSLLEYVDGGRD
jgi:excisionase family DNA binding protein